MTLSNELTPIGGAHPLAVDKRKTQKVALHHIAWSEVLHEAQMQLAHRGVADRLQAWLLAELIRYLEHPRSGAAGFDDMGPAWVAVREAVAARTLRPTDHKVGSVTTSWDRLVRHVCLRLTHERGVSFSPAFPRALATNPAARAQAAAMRLADEGTLSTTLRSPRTAGPLTITADLRTAQIRTSLDIDAPQDGGSSKRLNWLVRQLTTAPDSTTVEAAFARRGQNGLRVAEGRSGESFRPAAGTVGRGQELPHRPMRTDGPQAQRAEAGVRPERQCGGRRVLRAGRRLVASAVVSHHRSLPSCRGRP